MSMIRLALFRWLASLLQVIPIPTLLKYFARLLLHAVRGMGKDTMEGLCPDAYFNLNQRPQLASLVKSDHGATNVGSLTLARYQNPGWTENVYLS